MIEIIKKSCRELLSALLWGGIFFGAAFAFFFLAQCLNFQLTSMYSNKHEKQRETCTTDARNGQCFITNATVNDYDEFLQSTMKYLTVTHLYDTCQARHVYGPIIETTQVHMQFRDDGPLIYSEFGKPVGVMGVIQQMELRSQGDGCMDFLRFSKMKDIDATSETCGRFRYGTDFLNETKGPLSYISDDKNIHITYSIERNGEIKNDPTKVKITAFYECNPQLLSIEGEPLMKPCSPLHANSCIPADYFCDGVLNCANFNNGYGIGFDEMNCKGEDYPQYFFASDRDGEIILGEQSPPQRPPQERVFPMSYPLIFSVTLAIFLALCLQIFVNYCAEKNKKLHLAVKSALRRKQCRIRITGHRRRPPSRDSEVLDFVVTGGNGEPGVKIIENILKLHSYIPADVQQDLDNPGGDYSRPSATSPSFPVNIHV